ncbi:DsbA family oxidoreductase [Herbiconiux sp. P16]|uniref:DsbA family oxidoreductase n=1 Tax=Herbiconiux wuyangfengii TaxID=3342794 RepID=UPI0035BAE41E
MPPSTAPATPIKIDIWSDIACPWCYIGKRKFELGRTEFEATGTAPAVEIEYHSFELHPDTPVDYVGTERQWLMDRKGLSAAQVDPAFERAAGLAAAVGLTYNHGDLAHFNTIKAHQFVHFAKARGVQGAAMDRTLRAYFVEGRRVSDVESLADLGVELGFDRAEVARSLTTDEYLDDVLADKRQAAELGIQGVPFFVIDGKYGLSGAQDSATFTEALQRVATERAEVSAAGEGS